MTYDGYDRFEDGYVLASLRRSLGMSDAVDRAQAREQLDREFALQEQLTKRLQPGLATCCECGEPISALRQSIGARCCVICQEGIEAEEKRRTVRGCR